MRQSAFAFQQELNLFFIEVDSVGQDGTVIQKMVVVIYVHIRLGFREQLQRLGDFGLVLTHMRLNTNYQLI